MEIFIYVIKLYDEIVYVGQTKNFDRRRGEHIRNIKGNQYRLNDGRMLKLENCSIEIIDKCDYNNRLKVEEEYIIKFDTLKYGLNYCLAQTRPQTEEEKMKRSNTLKGRKFTEEHKRNLSKSRYVGMYSEEGKQKLSEAQKRRFDKCGEREKQSERSKKNWESEVYKERFKNSINKYYENATDEQRKRHGSGSRKVFIMLDDSYNEIKVLNNSEALALAKENNHQTTKPIDYAIKNNKKLYGYYWKKVLEKEYYNK